MLFASVLDISSLAEGEFLGSSLIAINLEHYDNGFDPLSSLSFQKI
jgi:hypothetical protein